MNGLYRIVGFVAFLAGSYRIGWIVYLDCIISAGLDWLDWIGSYRIVSDGSGHIGFYALAGYCYYGRDGTDGLDGALVGWGWDGRT